MSVSSPDFEDARRGCGAPDIRCRLEWFAPHRVPLPVGRQLPHVRFTCARQALAVAHAEGRPPPAARRMRLSSVERLQLLATGVAATGFVTCNGAAAASADRPPVSWLRLRYRAYRRRACIRPFQSTPLTFDIVTRGGWTVADASISDASADAPTSPREQPGGGEPASCALYPVGPHIRDRPRPGAGTQPGVSVHAGSQNLA